MTYQQCIDYFYRQLPMFQRTGPAALKSGLHNIEALCAALGNPHEGFRSVHIAGTNGKGSSSHMLAAVLQSAGYKTGLYTSPHLKDFRERIRIDGNMIPEQPVVDFVEEHKTLLDQMKPSFFELTVALAFDYFKKESVDIAIVEVGLGGRLDSTNITTPLVSLITNIGFDHSYLLGNTLELIAAEKAGIIKSQIPVIIGEKQPETVPIFTSQAQTLQAPIIFAQDIYQVSRGPLSGYYQVLKKQEMLWKSLRLQLMGPYQARNLPGVLAVLEQLITRGYKLGPNHIEEGLRRVIDLTGIKGRWQMLGEKPTVICDTGHNKPAMELLIDELKNQCKGKLHLVLGFVNDKDIREMLELMPLQASYYFCSANVPRSTDAHKLAEMAQEYQIIGSVVPDPNQALATAVKAANKEDLVFVGGSTFVVAELNQLN